MRRDHFGLTHEPRRRHPEVVAHHATQHQETPEGLAKFFTRPFNQFFGEEIARPRNDSLDGLLEVARSGCADRADIAFSQGRKDLLQNAEHALAGLPFGC